MTIRADRKVFRRDDFLFGFAGSFRMGQVLKYSFKIPQQSLPVTTDKYLHTSFIDGLRGAFISAGFTQSSLGQEFADGMILFGYRNKLYCVEPDFQIAESVDNFMSIGCGSQSALGSLYSSRLTDPTERVRQALETSERYSSGVRRPFYLLSDPGITPGEGIELEASGQIAPIVNALKSLESKVLP